MREEAPTQLQRTCVRRSLVGSSPAPNPFHHADSNTAQPQMDSGQEYPLQESGVEWTPSNLNLSANGQMIAEARAEGFTWSPSYLNIMSSNESCCCLSGAREVESPDKYGTPRNLDLTLAFLKEAVSVKADYFINTAYQPQIQGQNEGIATYHVTCHCTGPTSTKDERWDTETQPVEIGPKAELSPPVGLRGAVVGLEEVYVWEAKSYAGSEDSNKLEELRRAGKAPIPMGPGERSEEELGILPKQLYKDQHPQISDQIGEERPAPKKCPCAIGPKDTRLAQPLQVSEISHAVEAGEVIDPEHAVGIEKTVAALEDVYVWEAKSYAGSEDSDKMEMLRRAGKAPIPLGPGERSEEELGIAPRSMQPTLQQMDTFSGTRESPPKKKCCCAVPLAEPSHQISEISHTVQVGEVIDPEHVVGIEKAVAALEDVYVWEAKSYAGSEDSDKMEMLRRAGKAPIPLGPGERSEEELGIAPRSMQPTPQQIDAFSGTGISPPPKKVCCCSVPLAEPSQQISEISHTVQVGEIIDPEHAVEMEKAVAALEDVYVWEAKSYAGSEDSDKMEELRRAGKAPIPLGPGERSEEELGIAPRSMQPIPQQMDTFSGTGTSPPTKKVCCCAAPRAEPSQQVSQISHTVEVGEIIDPEHAVGMEKAVAALEDVYVWEAKSYAGSEDSNKMEELRRAGKAPIPLGPGERSEEELGIAPRSMQPIPQQMDTFSGTGISPSRKKPCCCATALAHPSQQVSEISHPVEVGQFIDPEHAVGVEKAVAALEDVYVWEAKSYAGSEDSDKMEVLRRAGKAPIPLGPGERSEEELGIAPRSPLTVTQQLFESDISVHAKKCTCEIRHPADPTQDGREHIPVESVQIIDSRTAVGMKKSVTALEDVYVWEAKSYAGSEDSNKMEELRRAGKAPIPLGPGERSEEELGISTYRALAPSPETEGTIPSSSLGAIPSTKKKCPCRRNQTRSQKTGDIVHHAPEVGQIMDPETTVGIEKAVAALEDVYVWEAKSYAGSEDSNRLEELRRAGKAPLPLGPGERSEEELGIRTVTLGLDQPYGDQSTLKTKCPCEKRLKGGGGCDKPNCDCPNPCEQIEIQNTQSDVPQNVLDRPVSEMSALCPRKTAGKCVKRSCRSEKQRMGPAGIAESHLPEKQDFVVQAKSAGLGERKKPCPCKARKDAKTTNKDEPRVEKRKCHCFLSPSQIDIHAAPDSCICKHCKKKRDKLAIQMGGAPPMPQWDYQLSYAQDQHDGPSVLDVYHHPPDGDESVDTLCMQFPESAVGVTSRSAAGIPDTAESTQSNLPWGNFCVANRKPPDLTFPSYAETAASADIEWQMQTCTCKPSVTERIEFLTHLLQQGISPLRDSLRELQLKIRDLGIPEFAELEKDSIGDICTCCPYTSPCAQLDAIDTFSQGPFKGPMPCPCVGIYIFPNDGQKSNGIDGPSEITDAAALPFVEQIDYTACTHCSHKYPPDAPISSSYIPPETSNSSPETPISPPGTSHSPPRTPEDFTKKYGLTSAVCTDEEITDSDNEKKPCCHAFRKRKTKSNR